MMPDCVSRNRNDPMSCGADRFDLYSPEPPWTRVTDLPANVLVYLDDNHLTATYAASMAPLIEAQVHAGLGW